MKASQSAIVNNEAPANAVRITSERTSLHGGMIKTPFPSFGLVNAWDFHSQAVAMQVDRDISLVLDRSGSMDWKTFDWPPGKSPWHPSIYNKAVQAGLLTKQGPNYYYAPGVSSDDYQSWVWSEHFELGPPPNSPWEDLKLAVSSFLEVLNGTVQTEQVSLASYASTASKDLSLQKNYQKVLEKLEVLGPSGATAIGQGMEAALPTLFEEGYGRPLAAKTIIVMTDGMHNSGTDPVTVAKEFVKQYNITIHTITFSPGADQVRMKEVAEIGGGQHYHADTGSELVEVFKQIANNLPTIVTQ